MKKAMRLHLGASVLSISPWPIVLPLFRKQVRRGSRSAFLEPSLDRVSPFTISKSGLHPLSTFCEYENESSHTPVFIRKIEHIPISLILIGGFPKEFTLKPEKLDKIPSLAHRFCSRSGRRHLEPE